MSSDPDVLDSGAALERLAFLTETAAGLLAGSDPIERVYEFFQRFSDRLGLEIFVQYRVAADGSCLELNSWAGFPQKYYRLLKRLEFGQAVCGTVAQNREPMYVDHVQQSTDHKTELIRRIGVSAYTCHPLIANGKLLGTLSFGSRRLSQFDEQTIYLLRSFCQMVASALERKQGEAELKRALDGVESEKNRLLAVMEALPIGLAIYDQTGADVLANRVYEEIWGSPRPPVRSIEDYPLYKAWWAGSGEPLKPEDWASAQAFLHGKTVTRQAIEIQGFDGVRRIVLNSGAPIRDAQGQITGCAVAIMDITARRRMEETLAASERKYREIIQYAPTAIYQIDFRTGRFISVNDSMVELSGYSREELLQKTGFDLLDEEGVALFKERIRRAMAGEKPDETVEYRVKAKDGHTIYAVLNTTFLKDESGRIIGATVIGHDITERKKAEMALRESEATLRESEQALRQSEFILKANEAYLLDSERVLREANERFRGSIENLNEAFVILSAVRGGGARAPGGEIVDFCFEYVNQVACVQVARPMERVKGHTHNEIAPEYRANGLFERYVQVVETGQPFQERFTYTGAENPEIQGIYEIRASKFGDGLIVTASDVTEQVRLEAEHREAKIQMEIHHRLAEQREKERQSIARDIHDGPIQTLSSLAFSLQYLKEAYADAGPALRLELDQIALSVKGAVQELREVMNELRPPTVIRFGLAKAVQMHAETLRERYPQTTWNLALDEDGQLLPDQTCLALFRIYQEAINNIVRHAQATAAAITYQVREDHVALEISDNGRGFENTQDVIALTNLQHFGLAGIAERAEAINGALEIESHPGLGTRVRVIVPVRQ